MMASLCKSKEDLEARQLHLYGQKRARKEQHGVGVVVRSDAQLVRSSPDGNRTRSRKRRRLKLQPTGHEHTPVAARTTALHTKTGNYFYDRPDYATPTFS